MTGAESICNRATRVCSTNVPDASEAGDRDLKRGGDGHMETRKGMTSLSVMQRVSLAMALLLLLSVGVFCSG